MISNSGKDENGRYNGGKAGDQTGGEWSLINWYNRPWKCVLRHPDANVRKMLKDMATAAAKNNLIGYDQNQRYTFWEHLKASNYDPAKITIACEADCSAGVAAMVKGIGYRLGIQKLKDVSIYLYTGNMRAGLKAAGFEVLTESKYLTSDAYLIEGDVLLNDTCHTATNLTNGSKATGTTSGGTSSGGTSSGGFKSSVRDFQRWLNNKFGARLDEDNSFGTLTKKAAVKAWQSTANSKFGAGLAVDGAFGTMSKSYGNKALVKNGSKNEFVYIAQGMLRAKGYYTDTLDGHAGGNTVNAIKKYQSDCGLSADGQCGANTWYSLFN